SLTEEQQREGTIEYNYERGGHAMDATPVPEPVAQFAAMCGTDAPTYTRERWTGSGACTSGSTAPPRGATRRASGGTGTTSTRRFLKTRARVATRRKRTREHSPLLPDDKASPRKRSSARV